MTARSDTEIQADLGLIFGPYSGPHLTTREVGDALRRLAGDVAPLRARVSELTAENERLNRNVVRLRRERKQAIENTACFVAERDVERARREAVEARIEKAKARHRPAGDPMTGPTYCVECQHPWIWHEDVRVNGCATIAALAAAVPLERGWRHARFQEPPHTASPKDGTEQVGIGDRLMAECATCGEVIYPADRPGGYPSAVPLEAPTEKEST